MPTPLVSDIVSGWRSHFWSADHELRWTAAEVEHAVWLTPNTLLAGRIDALGENDNGPFFGEWKTANPREAKTWKQVWRMNPQSLTYGVLANDWCFQNQGRNCSQFTVRKAFKSAPPTYDHAWYSYSNEELVAWMRELVRIADQIRAYGDVTPWETNWTNCFQFGISYPCPHFEAGCSKMVWGIDPVAPKRVPHLEIERRLNEAIAAENGTLPMGSIPKAVFYDPPKDVVILDATRVKTWLQCRERFRREYVHNIGTPMTEALQMGIDFHTEIGDYYSGLVVEQGVVNAGLRAGGLVP